MIIPSAVWSFGLSHCCLLGCWISCKGARRARLDAHSTRKMGSLGATRALARFLPCIPERMFENQQHELSLNFDLSCFRIESCASAGCSRPLRTDIHSARRGVLFILSLLKSILNATPLVACYHFPSALQEYTRYAKCQFSPYKTLLGFALLSAIRKSAAMRLLVLLAACTALVSPSDHCRCQIEEADRPSGCRHRRT